MIANGEFGFGETNWSEVPRDYTSEFAGATSPFDSVGFSPKDQTGGDWYALMLTASLGGKPVHGVTFAPTMEVIQKQDERFSRSHAVGRIRYRDTERAVPSAGDDWDERPTLGAKFLTSSTSTNTSMLFDTGTWESSMRSRAKNAAILAATIHTAGLDIEDAVEVASACAGERIDKDAVLNAHVPISMMRREAAGVAKASHSIFSRGNAQRVITWEDQNLGLGLIPDTGAFDWSRMTVIARFVGELNSRTDKRFRDYSKEFGVPYAIITGSWATVAAGDYAYDPNVFLAVERPSKEHMPPVSLADAYSDHQLDLYASIMKAVHQTDALSAPVDIAQFLTMAESMRQRKERVIRHTGSDVLGKVDVHRFGAEAAASAVQGGGTAHEATITAFTELVTTDRALKTAAAKVAATAYGEEPPEDAIEKLMLAWCQAPFWGRASAILAVTLNNPTTARDRMSSHKRQMTGSSSALQVTVGLTKFTRPVIKPNVTSAAKMALVPRAPRFNIPVSMSNFANATSLMARQATLAAARNHLTDYKEAWAARYEGKARVYAISATTDGKALSVKYGVAALAFRNLSVENVMSAEAGYIDAADPAKAYLTLSAAAYARKRRLLPPKVPARAVANSKDLASLLDKQYKPDVSFAEVEEFVTPRLAMFAMDLTTGGDPDFAGDEDEDEADDDEEDLDALLEAALGEHGDIFGGSGFVPPTVEAVAESYPEGTDPVDVARANGYHTEDEEDAFAEAYVALGAGARWDPETEYTKTYISKQAAIAREEAEAADAYVDEQVLQF